MNRITVDAWAMALVAVTSQRGTCLRRRVGCVLLDARNHVIATGYNGVASGMPHCNEGPPYVNACSGAFAPSGTNLDGCQAIHAEQNALLQCRNVYAIHTCYTSVSPCVTCVKLLMNTSCQKLVFAERYPHHGALDLWVNAGRSFDVLCTQEAL